MTGTPIVKVLVCVWPSDLCSVYAEGRTYKLQRTLAHNIPIAEGVQLANNYAALHGVEAHISDPHHRWLPREKVTHGERR